MEFKYNETTLWEHKANHEKDANSYLILAKDESVEDIEIQNIIQIVDESGEEVSCTYDKFVEIFDTEGLAGFIM